MTSRRSERPSRLFFFVFQDQLIDDRGGIGQRACAIARSLFVVRHSSTMLFRASQYFGSRWAPLGFLIKQWNHVLTGADLAWQAHIGPGLVLHHPTGVVLGPDVHIGDRCRIQQGVTVGGRGGLSEDGSPVIGDRAILGAGSRILGPIELGDDVVVGANAVVVRSYPGAGTLVGVPARRLRKMA